MNVATLPTDDIAGHAFEIISLDKRGDMWHAQFAVDNVLCPPFMEPAGNVHDLNADQFLAYMKGQALTMAQYWRESRGNA